jgi:hypothetical protein
MGFEGSWLHVFLGLAIWVFVIAFMKFQDKSRLQEIMFDKEENETKVD